MSTALQKQIALYASIVIGAGSGPFLFKAAGIPAFPQFQISHYIIIICYVTGAMMISRFLFLKLLSVSKNGTEKSRLE